MPERKPIFDFSTIITIIIIVIGWVMFAPTNIGGNTSYIILVGNSMEPLFYQGDLVLTRHQPHYSIGDIVAYRHPEIGVVFHRIIEMKDSSFILQGDNNSWADSHQASPNDIIGKYWFRINNIGSLIRFFRKPIVFTTTIIAFFIILIMNFFGIKNNSQDKLPKKLNSNQNHGIQKEVNMNKHIQDRISYLIVIAFFLLAVAIYAFMNPVKIISPQNIDYKNIGILDYQAVAPGNVFSNDLLITGDPIFRALTDSISLNFTYRLENGVIENVTGTFRLIAEISERNRWEREVELFPATTFSGKTFKVESDLDFIKIDELVENFENQTEVLNNQYTLTILPEVTFNGLISSTNFHETFIPAYKFSYDSQKVIPILDESDNGFVHEKTETVSILQESLNRFSFLGLSIPYNLLRIISLLCLIALTTFIIFMIINIRKNEHIKQG